MYKLVKKICCQQKCDAGFRFNAIIAQMQQLLLAVRSKLNGQD
jgi:hypothetical protein